MFNSTITSKAYTNTATQTAPSADVYAKVEKQMLSQNTGVAKLNNNLTRDQTKLSALGQLQSALAKFQGVAQNMTGGGLATSATSSAAGVLQATTTEKAASGSYAIDVKQLAQGQTLATAAQKASNTAIGTALRRRSELSSVVLTASSFLPVTARPSRSPSTAATTAWKASLPR